MVTTTLAEHAVDVTVRYLETPSPVADEGRFHLRLPTDALRPTARLVASPEQPQVVRDGLLALMDVLSTDLRFKARDRSDYLAYLTKKGKKATKAVWDAQKEFLAARYGEAAQEETPLDPVVTVSSDGVLLEVFSRDESAYASLHIPNTVLRLETATPGTTHVRLNPLVRRSLGRMRSYRSCTLELFPSEGGKEQTLKVPHRWLRAFGQVQAASTLPMDRFQIAPIDLYNVLLTLRRRKARKPPRGLRYELIPGQKPRLVLEPWGLVLEAHGELFQGSEPRVVRTWGRNRLQGLARLLPHARNVRVQLAGPGLPAFYVVDLGGITFTLALSGWTDSGWAGVATFDLLVPGAVDEILAQNVLSKLHSAPMSLEALAEATGRPKGDVHQALLFQLVRGLVLHDVATDTFRSRPLVMKPLDAQQLRYRDPTEAQAHRLLEIPGQVKLVRVHDLGGEGTSIEGEVQDQKAHRTYLPAFTLDREGRTTRATCTCPAFRRAGIKEGPCAHMMALRVMHVREQTKQEQARQTAEGRKLIRAETRTLVKRTAKDSTMCRMSLDDRQVVLRWALNGETPRVQRLFFSSADDARQEYFARLADHGRKGFVDASAAETV